MKKVLILGGTGMLGHMLYNYLNKSNNFQLFNLCYKVKLNDDSVLCDATNQEETSNIIQKIAPDIIVNCIGVLIIGSNKNIQRAIYLNAYFPHWLKDLCDTFHIKLIHISTDCVFDGNTGRYDEESQPNALDLYGKTKSLGEFNSKEHLCIRTSIIGPELKTMGEGLLHWLFQQKGEIYGYKNVLWSGVTTLELAKVIAYSIHHNIDGLWNVTNGRPISKYDLLKKLINSFSLNNITLKENSEKRANKSLISTRNIKYQVPDYGEMLHDLAVYQKNFSNQYNYRI